MQQRTLAQSACIASTPAVPLSCNLCTPISTQPSSLSSPSCGKQALSDHRNQIACGHIDAFLVRRVRPIYGKNLLATVLSSEEWVQS